MSEFSISDHEGDKLRTTNPHGEESPASSGKENSAGQAAVPSAFSAGSSNESGNSPGPSASAPGASTSPSAAQSVGGTSQQTRWQPLRAIERRVVGVLAEKAKTVPDAYPMSVNAICTGCNQKNNRDPVMQLEPADVEEALERLRAIGAVGMVEGYGRVSKYRHYLYEWLGVDKVELAVMTELLLRGPQTLGELRARASRMEPIADLTALRTICDTLKRKGLVVYLTPEGRGQIVSHALYPPREMENLRARHAAGRVGVLEDEAATGADGSVAGTAGQAAAHLQQPSACGNAGSAELQERLSALTSAVEHLRQQMQELVQRIGRLENDVQSLKHWIEG